MNDKASKAQRLASAGRMAAEAPMTAMRSVESGRIRKRRIRAGASRRAKQPVREAAMLCMTRRYARCLKAVSIWPVFRVLGGRRRGTVALLVGLAKLAVGGCGRAGCRRRYASVLLAWLVAGRAGQSGRQFQQIQQLAGRGPAGDARRRSEPRAQQTRRREARELVVESRPTARRLRRKAARDRRRAQERWNEAEIGQAGQTFPQRLAQLAGRT